MLRYFDSALLLMFDVPPDVRHARIASGDGSRMAITVPKAPAGGSSGPAEGRSWQVPPGQLGAEAGALRLLVTRRCAGAVSDAVPNAESGADDSLVSHTGPGQIVLRQGGLSRRWSRGPTGLTIGLTFFLLICSTTYQGAPLMASGCPSAG